MRIFKIHKLTLFISFICLVSIPNISFPNKLDRAFKALAENNFPKAKTLFSDELEENPKNFVAIFGLGQYYYLPRNPEMNIDSTYSKWNYCYINFSKATPDEIELINQYYKISEKILFQNLHDLCERAFNSLMSNLSLNNLNRFISKYKIRTALLQKATIMRDDSLLKNLKSEVSIENLNLFISNNQSFTRLSTVKQLRDSLEYERAISINSIDSYNLFLKNYPNSNWKTKVETLKQNLEYIDVMKEISIPILEKFINEKVNSPFVLSVIARRDSLTFKKAQELNTIENYQNFINTYAFSKYTLAAIDSIDNQNISKILRSNTSTDELYKFIIENRSNKNIDSVWNRLFDNTIVNKSVSLSEFEAKYNGYPLNIREKIYQIKKNQKNVTVSFKKIPTHIGKYENNLIPVKGYFDLPVFKTNKYELSELIHSINEQFRKFDYKEIDFKNATELYQGKYETHLPILDSAFVYNDNCILSTVSTSEYYGYGNYAEIKNHTVNINTFNNDSITLQNSFHHKDLITKTVGSYIQRMIELQKWWSHTAGQEGVKSGYFPNMNFSKFSKIDWPYSEDDEELDKEFLLYISSNSPLELYKTFFITADSIFFFHNPNMAAISEMSRSYSYGGNFVGFSVEELLPYIKPEGGLKLFIEGRNYSKNKKLNKNKYKYNNLETNQIERDSIKSALTVEWLVYKNQIANVQKYIKRFAPQSDFEKDVDYLARVKELELVLPTIKNKNYTKYFDKLSTLDNNYFTSPSVKVNLDPKNYDPNTGKWHISYIDSLFIKSEKQITIKVAPKFAEKLFNNFNKSVNVVGLYQQLFHKNPILRKISFVENNEDIYSFDTDLKSIDTNSHFEQSEKVKFLISPDYQYCVFNQDKYYNERNGLVEGETISLIDYENGISQITNFNFREIYNYNFDYLGDFLFISTNDGVYNYNLTTKTLTKIEDERLIDIGSISFSHPCLPFQGIICISGSGKSPEENERIHLKYISLYNSDTKKLFKSIPIDDDLYIKSFNDIQWKNDGSLNLQLNQVRKNQVYLKKFEVDFINSKLLKL